MLGEKLHKSRLESADLRLNVAKMMRAVEECKAALAEKTADHLRLQRKLDREVEGDFVIIKELKRVMLDNKTYIK